MPGWPAVAIPVSRWPNRWTTRIEDFPVGLRGEIADLLAWAVADDPLADDEDLFAGIDEGRRHHGPRRADTVQGWHYMLRTYVSVLLEAGIGFDRLTSLEALVDPQIMKVGMRGLLARSPSGNRHRASSTAILLKVLGRDFLKLDRQRVEVIAKFCRRVRPKQDGLTAKNKERLAIFKDKRRLRELVQLPQRLMQRALAAAEDDDGPKPARMAQLAVAIEIFLMAPMRIGNLIGSGSTGTCRRWRSRMARPPSRCRPRR